MSENGRDDGFYYPGLVNGELQWVVAWSRVFVETELLCAINTNLDKPLQAWVTVDELLHEPGTTISCLFSTQAGQVGEKVTVETLHGAAVRILVPAGGFVLYG